MYIPMRDGDSLHVSVIGSGQPVLMLPGLTMASWQWLVFVLPHTRRFRFYMPDFRGHGASRHARLNQTDVFENHAQDVADVIAHLKLDDFLLAGISLGATTAMHLQRDGHLGQVKRYLHIDQSPCVLNQPDWRYGLAGEKQEQLIPLMQAVLAALEPHAYLDHFADLPPRIRWQLLKTFAPIFELLGISPMQQTLIRQALSLPTPLLRRVALLRLQDLIAYLRAYSGGGHDYRANMAACTIPTTVFAGARSALYAPQGQRLLTPDPARDRFVLFARSGHVPLLNEPLPFHREFSRFLQDR